MHKKCPRCGKEWEGYHDESNSNHICPRTQVDVKLNLNPGPYDPESDIHWEATS